MISVTIKHSGNSCDNAAKKKYVTVKFTIRYFGNTRIRYDNTNNCNYIVALNKLHKLNIQILITNQNKNQVIIDPINYSIVHQFKRTQNIITEPVPLRLNNKPLKMKKFIQILQKNQQQNNYKIKFNINMRTQIYMATVYDKCHQHVKQLDSTYQIIKQISDKYNNWEDLVMEYKNCNTGNEKKLLLYTKHNCSQQFSLCIFKLYKTYITL